MINKFISGYATTYKTMMPDIALTDPNIEGKFMDTLPLVNKTDYPLSSIQARTSWQLGQKSNAAIAHFEAKEKVNATDHMHADVGSFQLYYKGYLAIDAGNYQGKSGGAEGTPHYFNYYTRSIAHNCMTVFDPNETTFGPRSNDGGQKIPSMGVESYDEYMNQQDSAKTEGWFVGPNKDTPEFSFIKTNLTTAYGEEKVKNHERSMVFMDLDNEDYPAAVVIFDDLTSGHKSFKKKWIMNTVAEPEISGNTTVVKRNDNGNNGKLVNKTFLPEEPVISTVGGDGMESYVNGTNYPNADYDGNVDSEQGKWRVEISPSAEQTRDLFLNSMYVTDCDRELPELPMYREDSDALSGVTVMDRAVYFSKKDMLTGSVKLSLRNNGYDTVKCLVTDIEAGLWKVSGPDGVKICRAESDENSLYFRGVPGEYTLTKVTSGTPDNISYEKMQKPMYGDFLVYNEATLQFLTLNSPTITNDGVRMVPLRETFKEFGGEITVDNGIIGIKLPGKNYRIALGDKTAYFDDNPVTLSAAPVLVDGVTYVCAEDFNCWGTKYDTGARVLSLKPNQYSDYGKKGLANYVIPVSIETENGNTVGKWNVSDGNFGTTWKTEGINKQMTLNLGAVYKIDKIDISFSGDGNIPAFFKIDVSTDGVNFQNVYSGLSESNKDGLTTVKMPDGTNAKFIQLRSNGNMLNISNNINEIVVTKGGE